VTNPVPLGLPEIDPDDVGHGPRRERTLTDLIAVRMSRRKLLGLGLASGGMALLSACGGGADGKSAATGVVAKTDATGTGAAGSPSLSFGAVAKHVDDVVTVPQGYSVQVLYRLGDPIAAHVGAYRNDGTDDPRSFEDRAGDHHDGMTFFGVAHNGKWDPAGADRGLLVMNHEAITPVFLHPAGQSTSGSGAAQVRSNADEVLREFYVHGVSIIDVRRDENGWRYRQNSSSNRRIHTLTEMKLSGPAGGTHLMATRHAPDGRRTRGTLNNCANGTTPWGTYLTCEENWAGYFRRIVETDNPKRSRDELTRLARYGVAGNGRELWATVIDDSRQDLYDRWNAQVRGAGPVDDYRNAPNTYGWVVEIDPFHDGRDLPRKRTALGRFAHEGAELGKAVPGQPLTWYMGDDSRGEYLYKFVSAAPWDPADRDGGYAAGDKYLDAGRLYVARFDADGTGTWIELSYGANGLGGPNDKYMFADQADVLVHARLAADAVRATPMDRPEWAASHPVTGEIYLTLTNTNASARPIDKTDAANPRFYNDPKGPAGTAQRGNPNGHVVRLAEAAGTNGFRWDIYLFGARETAPADVNLSGLIADNDFSSPDGMWFSRANPGLLWLQTDDGAYTDVTNCMMLAAVPGRVGDGGPRTITNVNGATTLEQGTFVGRPPGSEGLRRFLVGPKGCEVTGIAESGDGRALFVNIQHPGEDTDAARIADPAGFQSHWPDSGASRPRSATIVITRDDGGPIGV
jgi:secreted PhoX family phosphatase